MLKLAIAATVWTIYCLSICNVADASTNPKSNNLTSQAKYISSDKQSQSNIVPKSDLEGIRSTITDHFQDENDRINPTADHKNRRYSIRSVSNFNYFGQTDCPFQEIKNLRVSSFRSHGGTHSDSNGIATLEAEIITTVYDAKRNSDEPRKWIFTRKSNLDGRGYYTRKKIITVQRIKGKWTLTSIENI